MFVLENKVLITDFLFPFYTFSLSPPIGGQAKAKGQATRN